jgi:hypothetical protein
VVGPHRSLDTSCPERDAYEQTIIGQIRALAPGTAGKASRRGRVLQIIERRNRAT